MSSDALDPNFLKADRIYRGGPILTMNDAQPQVEALAVRGKRILAVGTWEELQKWVGRDTEVTDLEGHTLVPGFIDAHGHIMGWLLYWGTPDLAPKPPGQVEKIQDIIDALKKYIAEKAIPKGTLVLASGYDDSLMKELRHPNRDEMDEVSKEHYVCIVHTSAHLAVFNSLLLDGAGYHGKNDAPAGGAIQVDKDGIPTGVVEEEAVYAYQQFMPKVPDVPGMLRALKEVQQRYASLGITTVEDGLSPLGSVVLLQLAAALGVLFLDVRVYPKWTEADAIDKLPLLPRKNYVGHLKVAGVKITQDGSPQGRTAYLTKPYHQVPPNKPDDYRGEPILKQEELNAHVEKAFEKGWQLHIHCNGDAAADMMLDALELATKKFGHGDRRPVMIHAQTVRDDQLDRMVKLGVEPSFFVAHTYFWGEWHRKVTLGEERARRISPLRSAAERRLRYTIHNDSPVVPPDITPLMWSAVTRTTRDGVALGPDQCATPLEALKAVTVWAAHQNFEEDDKGTLEPGKLADMVVLSGNPLTVPSEVLNKIQAMETIKGGKTVFRRDPEIRNAPHASTEALHGVLKGHTCC
jgi:predicted amidohydrolase YtcJ